MKVAHCFGLLLLAVAIAVIGCGGRPSERSTPGPKGGHAEHEAKIKANLAKLSDPEDRKLAEAQKYCPISDEPLGTPEMGVPIKVMVDGQPVFLCCKSCERKAKADPAKTLARVKELKAKKS